MGTAPSSEAFWAERFAERAVVFVHPPRTGGSAVEGAVFLAGGEAYPGPQHLSAAAWRRRLGGAFDKAFRFASVRNPYTRIISACEVEEVQRWVGGGGFRRCVEKLAKRPAEAPLMLRPQADFLAAEDGTLLVDALVRQESLGEDLRLLEAEGSVRLRRPVPAKDLASRYIEVNVEAWYDGADLVAAVADVYERDFRLLGYDPAALPSMVRRAAPPRDGGGGGVNGVAGRGKPETSS